MATPKAEFLGGGTKVSDFDRLKIPDVPRVAFVGRSNVGKSSLLNAMAGVTVARVSQEPGKTREMNFYHWRASHLNSGGVLLVDLPGYGFAKVSRGLQHEWGKEILKWMTNDEMLACTILLVDGRHGFMNLDVEFVRYLAEERLPFFVAFTKMDKYKSKNQLLVAKRELKKVAEELGTQNYVFVSAVDRDGLKDLTEQLKEVLSSFREERSNAE